MDRETREKLENLFRLLAEGKSHDGTPLRLNEAAARAHDAVLDYHILYGSGIRRHLDKGRIEQAFRRANRYHPVYNSTGKR